MTDSDRRPTSGPTALGEDLVALAGVAREWLATHSPKSVVRERLEAPAEDDSLPPFWADLADIGWSGLAVPEAAGGQGAGPAGLATAVEEWGRAVAPG
ncbi:MAG: acyl-CoA dehydrogenase family protein, partial [Microthrixaceae bacterium]